MDVKQERTGWRDQALSERHRMWGFDCPAVDIDFLMLEYDGGKAMGLVEYKNEHATIQHANHASYRALVDLADRGNRGILPVLGVRYTDNFSLWTVTPLNSEAKKYVSTRTEMNEEDYVKLLYKIRGRIMPIDLIKNLNIKI